MIIEQRELKVKDYTLRGLFSKPDDGYKTIVVMFHGFTGHKNEHGYLFKQLTQTLVDQHIATLRYDFMGNGESDGDFADYTLFTEIDDGLAVIEEAYQLNQYKPIVLLGFSMGGAIASRVSLLVQDRIEKMILLSPAGNIPEIIQKRFAQNSVNLDGNIDMGGYYMNIAIQKSFEGYDMYKDIETFTKPVLIMQGSCDQAVPPKYSKRYDDLYPNSEYILVDGSEHGYAKVAYRQIIHQKVTEFLK